MLGKAVLASLLFAALLLVIPSRPQLAVFRKHVVTPIAVAEPVPLPLPTVQVQTEIFAEQPVAPPIVGQQTEQRFAFNMPSLATLFLGVHAILSSVLLLRFFVGTVQAAKIRTKSLPMPGEKNVRTSRHITAPVVLGIFRPVILLPETFCREENAESVRLALVHEREHLENGDLRTVFLARLLKILLPLQPLLGLLLRRIRQEQEILADAAVCRNSCDIRMEYAAKLVHWTKTVRSASRRTAVHAIGLWEFQSTTHTVDTTSLSANRRYQMNELTRRIGTILDGSQQVVRKNSRRWNFSLSVCLIAAVFALSSVTLQPKIVAQQEEQKEPGTERSEVPGLDDEDVKLQPNPVKEGKFETSRRSVPAPVQDVKKVDVRGLVLMPNGEVAEGINWFFSGGPGGGWSISTGAGEEVSGKFDADIPANASYVVAVFDKRNRFAAPLQTITVGDESPEGELVFQFEEGVPLTATFVDEETGTPIPGLRISLMQKAKDSKRESQTWFKIKGESQIWFEKMSDEKGLFEAHVMPGEYIVAVDLLFNNATEVRKGTYARKFVAEAGKPVSLEFKIPAPFVGKVLNLDGTPAKNRVVFVLPNNMMSGTSTFTRTDENGVFRCVHKPVNATIEVLELGSGSQYFAWFGKELATAKEHTFQLIEGVEVTGRFLDAKTKEPLDGQLFWNWKTNPSNPKLKQFLPSHENSDASGRFSIRLNPTVVNDLFIVYGRQSTHGGGPYEPRIKIATLEPEQLKDKDVIDLGDIFVEP